MLILKNLLAIIFPIFCEHQFKYDDCKLNSNLRTNHPSFIKFLFFQDYHAFTYLTLDLIIFILNLGFIYGLYLMTMNDHEFIIIQLSFSIIILLKYISSSIRLSFDVKVKKNLVKSMQFKFNKLYLMPHDYQKLTRLVSRDINILIDFISISSRVIYFPIAIVIGIFVIYYLIGLVGVISVMCIAIITGFLSFFIARKSIKLARKIFTISKQRIDNANIFIKYREYLKNWGELRKIRELDNITDKEISLRNKDSFWRALDLYTILFSGSLSVVLVLSYNFFLSKENLYSITALLWFSIPIITIVMEIGRFCSDYTIASEAYKELNHNLYNDQFICKGNAIELNDKWEIWKGSLADNILDSMNINKIDLFTELELCKEFKNKNIPLEFLGKNISQGQKTKILLIRAIYIAIYEKKSLSIKISLNSLDPISCKNLLCLFSKIKKLCKINLTNEQNALLKKQVLRSCSYTDHYLKDNVVERQEKNNPTEPLDFYSKDSYFKLFSYASIFFIVPAFLLNFNTYLMNTVLNLRCKILYISFFTLFSILFASFIGYIVEKKNRHKAKILLKNFLLNSMIDNISDVSQRISQDFIVMVERISWYIHDIAWYQSLILIALTSVAYSYGIKGMLVNVLFIIAIGSLWWLFLEPIRIARKNYIESINYTINSLMNLVTTSSTRNSFLIKKRQYWLSSGFSQLYKMHIKMVVTRGAFSNLIHVITGVFLILATSLSTLINVPTISIIFVINSLLVVESIIINLFHATMGLSSNIFSYTRLKSPQMDKTFHKNLILYQREDEYVFEKCVHPKLGTKYNELVIKSGVIYSITGSSGCGKSEYLKSISNFYSNIIDKDQNFSKVLYLSKEALDILYWIEERSIIRFVKNKILLESYKVVILDEVFDHLDIQSIIKIINELKEFILYHNITVLFVDHRIELKSNILISKIINLSR